MKRYNDVTIENISSKPQPLFLSLYRSIVTSLFLSPGSKYIRLILVVLTLTACHKKEVKPVIPSYPVKTGTSVQKEAPIYIEALGHVDSITAISIKSRIEGEMTGVHFTQGQEVKRNDLLFTIDPRPYQAALKEAEATLEENTAKLALAAEKVKRYRLLAKDEYYSQIDYETLQADLAANTALVEQNRAQVDSAKINLNYCWIYAPIDGMTGILQVDYGNLVSNDETVLTTLNQMAPIYVTFSIPEFQLPKVQKYYRDGSMKVLAAYEDFSEDVFEGKLFMINNAVDDKTGMIQLRAIFANNKRELWPGQFVRTRLILDTISNAIMIPNTAVQLTQNGPVVFVVKGDNTVDQRSVKLGQREEEDIIVTEGLIAGETIVVEGQLNLYPGAKVNVR